MQMTKISALVACLMMSYGGSLLAGAPSMGGGVITTISANKQTQTRLYAGVVWNLNQKTTIKPDYISTGVRSVVVKSNDNVSGADLNFRLNLTGKDINLDSVRLFYVGGNRDTQGQLGAGYSFTQQSYLGTIAGSSAYSRLGADYLYKSKEFKPFFEINTLDKPKKVNPTVTETVEPI
jgi:hypothetical protein